MGAYHALVQELRETDSRGFANFLLMDVESFEILLRRVAPLIARQDTVLRLCIQPEERLALTLRWLATRIRPVPYFCTTLDARRVDHCCGCKANAKESGLHECQT